MNLTRIYRKPKWNLNEVARYKWVTLKNVLSWLIPLLIPRQPYIYAPEFSIMQNHSNV